MKKSTILFAILYYGVNFLVLPYLFVRVGSWLGFTQVHSTALQVLGVFIIVLALVNIVYCYKYFLKNGKGTPMSFQPTQAFLTSGPFAHTRNPLYVSQFVVIAGEVLFFGSSALLLYLVGFVAVYHFVVIPFEEKKNEQRFGQRYLNYKNTTPRYL